MSINGKQNQLQIEPRLLKYAFIQNKGNFYGKIYYEFNEENK